MILYMSSYKLGNSTEYLKKVSDKFNKICIIPNAMDVFPDGEGRTSRLEQFKQSLEELGFISDVLDLRDFFNKPEELQKKLLTYDGCYVVGGNSFTLISAMKVSGFDKFLLSNKDNNNFLYIGFSAGICILGPTLHGIDLCDEPEKLNYTEYPIYEGLNLIDFVPIPHYDTPEHPESKMMENVKQYMIENNINYKTLSDGDVILDGFEENLLKKK